MKSSLKVLTNDAKRVYCAICTGGFVIVWSLGITAPNREFVVARALDKWGFRHHVFKIKRRIVHRGIAADRLFPAFPSYVFLITDGCWEPLRAVFGIIEFVRAGDRVAVLPSSIMNSLLKVAGPEDVLPIAEPAARFRLGDRVLIRGMSLLAGQHATFQHQLADGQTVVLIDWMGRYVPVAIDERDLAAAGEKKSRSNGRRNNRQRRSHKLRVEPRTSSSRATQVAAG